VPTSTPSLPRPSRAASWRRPCGVASAPATALVGLAALALAACASGRGRGPAAHPLLRPDPAAERAAAPDTFWVRMETTKGPFTVQVVRAWAPRGADRFHYLVTHGFYAESRFFRVLPGFVAQFGASGDPSVSKVWDVRTFPDDPVRRTNVRGTVSFATAGPNTRTTQLFVNLRDNGRLDRLGFAPIGRVVDGMAVVDSLYAGYGEGPPKGKGPDQERIASEGTRYLSRVYPRMDWIRSATVTRGGEGTRASGGR
jgi:peptidyl-prolyl cis-trans isomerase A (cyclophilin A)